MNGINAIKDRDAGRLFCRYGLDATDELMPFLRSVCMSSAVQDAAHTQVDEDVFQFLRVESMGFVHVLALLHADHVEVSWVISPALSSRVNVFSTLSMKASLEDTECGDRTRTSYSKQAGKPANSVKERIVGVMSFETKLQVYEIHLGGAG